MQIVIEIDEDTYRYMQSRCKYQNKGDKGLSKFEEAGVAIKNGTPLPKGHGRIADIDKVLEEMKATRTYDIPFALERVKPIIEADNGDGNDWLDIPADEMSVSQLRAAVKDLRKKLAEVIKNE